jgi:hypothetical protein
LPSHRPILFLAAAATLITLSPSTGRAIDLGSADYTLSGFGTLGEVHANDDQADFTSSVFEPNGAGYTREWSASVDSLVGLQFNGQCLPDLSAVVQVIGQQQFDDHVWPDVEWANLRYQITPDLSVRAGRIELPTLINSESRQVGYANPWLRPPPEVYSLLPINHNDGVDVTYRLNVQDLTNTLQAMFGSNVEHTPPAIGGDARSNDLWGFSETAEYGHLTLHLAYVALHLTIAGLDPLFDSFAAFGPQGQTIAQLYDVDAKPFITRTLGVSYDPGRWFAIAEWGHADTNFFQGDNTAWYLTAGYRVRQLTPYATFAQRRTDAFPIRGLSLAGLSTAQAAEAQSLNATLGSLLAGADVQQSVSLGTRWDFYENLDLKLQYDDVRLGPGSSGLLINLQPGFRRGSTYALLSAAIDFVF